MERHFCCRVLQCADSLPPALGKAQTADQDNVVLRWNQAALDSIVATRTATPAIAAGLLRSCTAASSMCTTAYDKTQRRARG